MDGKFPYLTATIQKPTTAYGSGCNLTMVIANRGKGWGPNTFEVLTKGPRGREVQKYGALLGLPLGFSYESGDEYLLGVDIGMSLSGPFEVIVDPANKVHESDESNNTSRYSNTNIACNVG